MMRGGWNAQEQQGAETGEDYHWIDAAHLSPPLREVLGVMAEQSPVAAAVPKSEVGNGIRRWSSSLLGPGTGKGPVKTDPFYLAELAPRTGLEPVTRWLTATCSTN